jgi:hypothetical protein
VFAWHARPYALERLTPPWEDFVVERRERGLRDGGEVWIRQRFNGLWFRWHNRHSGYVENRAFVDEAVRGPFPVWRHTHAFTAEGDGTVLADRIEYAFPLGGLTRPLLEGTVRRRLVRAFRHREETLRSDLQRHRRFAGQGRRRIAIAGASGFLGRNLTAFLSTGGHEVLRLVRRPAREPDEVAWDPAAGRIKEDRLEGLDAIIHLGGESLEQGRWTAARKRALVDSRVRSTEVLSRAVSRLRDAPRLLVVASAVGFYGDRGDAVLTETADPGTGFLADLCRAWEGAAAPAVEAGVRVVHARTGVVLSPAAGLLRRLLSSPLPPCIGSGQQWVSWVALDDFLYALQRVLFTDSLRGPVNVTSPEPARSLELSRTLARLRRRPMVLLPSRLLAASFGVKAVEGLLFSQRAVPAKLAAAGHAFARPHLEDALRACLGAW